MKLLIKHIVPGRRITSFFALEAMELRESRNKRPYLLLTLSDRTGSIRGYLWGKDPARTAGALKAGRVVKVDGVPKAMGSGMIINVVRIRSARRGEIDRGDFAPSGQLELFNTRYEQNPGGKTGARKEIAA